MAEHRCHEREMPKDRVAPTPRPACGAVPATETCLPVGPQHDAEVHMARLEQQLNGLCLRPSRKNPGVSAVQTAEGASRYQVGFTIVVQALQHERRKPYRAEL